MPKKRLIFNTRRQRSRRKKQSDELLVEPMPALPPCDLGPEPVQDLGPEPDDLLGEAPAPDLGPEPEAQL